MAQVVLENLYKTFPQVGSAAGSPATPHQEATVLRRINLTVREGEFMVLVGPSGCGKSTLLRLISGLEPVTAGQIWVGDRCVTHLPPKQRDTAMVFQSYALYPHLTVYNNLAFGLRRMRSDRRRHLDLTAPETASGISGDATGPPGDLARALARSRGWQDGLTALTRRLPKGLRYISPAEKRIDQRVRQVAQMLQIEPLLGRLPRQLSGGQKQRVALGRAMARNPQVFLMDEPLSNLDAQLRTETRSQIVNLQRQLGITTLYVTHDQVEAMTMGDRIAVMHQGQIQQLATPLTLYEQPANRFVAGFMGSPTMNFLTVQVNAPHSIVHDRFRLTLPADWEGILKSYDGQSVTLGIRPEHLRISLPAPKNLQVIVARVEALGSETYVTVKLGETALQARLAPEQRVTVGEELWLAIAPEKVHLFDPDSGASLRHLNPTVTA